MYRIDLNPSVAEILLMIHQTATFGDGYASRFQTSSETVAGMKTVLLTRNVLHGLASCSKVPDPRLYFAFSASEAEERPPPPTGCDGSSPFSSNVSKLGDYSDSESKNK